MKKRFKIDKRFFQLLEEKNEDAWMYVYELCVDIYMDYTGRNQTEAEELAQDTVVYLMDTGLKKFNPEKGRGNIEKKLQKMAKNYL